MLEKQFGKLGYFIERRYKIIIVIWIVAVLAFLPFAAKSIGITNYNVEFTSSNHNTMSSEAQSLFNETFNKTGGNSSNKTNLVLFINSSLYSNSYDVWNSINSSYKPSLKGTGISGIVSPYPIASQVVNSVSNATYMVYEHILTASNSTISSFVEVNNSVVDFEGFASNLKNVDSIYLSTYQNISRAVVNYTFLMNNYEQGISGASSVIYGIPIQFINIYNTTTGSNVSRNMETKDMLLQGTGNFNNNSSALFYFNLFYEQWNNTNNSNSSSGPISERLNSSIYNAFSEFYSNLTSTQQQFYEAIYNGFNVSTYSNPSEKRNVTLSLVYEFSSPFGRADPQLFNTTYENFIIGGNVSRLSESITGESLNQTQSFTIQFFNETPTEFTSYITAVDSISPALLEKQMNESTLSPSITSLYESLNMTPRVFYQQLLANNTSAFKQYFTATASVGIEPLSSSLGQNSSYMISYFLNEGSNSSSEYFTKLFLEDHFAGYPYFHFTNPQEFTNDSLTSKGNLTSEILNDYPAAGIALNSSLFQTLVTPDFSGYLIVLDFNVSSLNGTQLNIVNNYISGIHNEFPATGFYFTSSNEISHGLKKTAYSGLIYSLLVGIAISIIIVGVYFRSPLLAFVPLLFFGVAFSITYGIIYLIFGVIEKTTLSFVVTTLSSIIILGLSTDYSVYILNRYIRERSEDKLKSTVQWAGHAVFTSGVTVIISYAVLAVFNIPIIGDGGFVNALGIAISLGVALTLLPSSIRMFRKRLKEKNRRLNFEKIAAVSIKHRKALVVVLVVIFVSTLVVYEATPTSFDLFSLIPNNQGKVGYYEMVSAFGGDALSPGFVLLTFAGPVYSNGQFNQYDIGVMNNVTSAMLHYSGIAHITTINYPFGNKVDPNNLVGSSFSVNTTLNQSLSFIGKNGETVMISYYTKSNSYVASGIHETAHLDTILKNVVPAGTQYLVGGSAQGLVDSGSTIDTSTYMIIEILGIIIFAVLAYQLSSVFTPLRLLFNVVTSALMAITLFYLVFHYALNYPIIVFGPLFVFVTLFGVGLDYDIFLITRTRESVMKGKSDEDAISEALNENAGVILVLGFILAGVFGSLIFSPIGIISEIGFAVTVGVLIDTAISWLFLIPALMLVMKRYNWWPSHIGSGNRKI